MSKTLKQLKQEYSELLEDLNFNLREQLKVVAGERYSSGKGVVYFINQVGTENYKIGFSRNYDTRKAIFNVKLPFAIEETFVYETENYKELEAALHDYFSDNRLNDSEFFHLPATIIASIPNLCRKLEAALLEERDREDDEDDDESLVLQIDPDAQIIESINKEFTDGTLTLATISTSLLQRRYRIGYSRAARIKDRVINDRGGDTL